ncbi:tetratricopeptide repeat protein [Paludibacterium purpuratum]|nr:tetratricopeptide repeat protein [Paludibacterium purpuratum]
MSSDIQLDAKTYQAIEQRCEAGDRLTESDDLAAALVAYQEAWDLLPDPKRAWEAATWIKIAIADAHFFAGQFDAAVAELDFALTCPGGLINPYIDLRMGQCLLELGQTDEARECLSDALAEAGEEIFEGEESKYLALAREGGQ